MMLTFVFALILQSLPFPGPGIVTPPPGSVATPSYDHGTGSYFQTVTVTISDGTSGATIIYCQQVGADCSPVGGTTYTTPLTITTTNTHLCAYATHAGMTDSSVICATYTINPYQIPSVTSVGSGSCETTNTTGSFTTSAGDTIEVSGGWCNGSSCTGAVSGTVAVSVTGLPGDTFSCPAVNTTGTGVGSAICYVCSSVGGSHTYALTVSNQTGVCYLNVLVASVNGVKSTACLDATTASSVGAASHTNISITTGSVSQAGEFCSATAFNSGGKSFTPAGTDIFGSGSAFDTQYIVGSASGTQTLSWTNLAATSSAAALCLEHP